MRSVTIPLTTITNAFIECECGNEMHPAMNVCGDCMNDETNVIGRGQRVFIHTRRAFKYGN